MLSYPDMNPLKFIKSKFHHGLPFFTSVSHWAKAKSRFSLTTMFVCQELHFGAGYVHDLDMWPRRWYSAAVALHCAIAVYFVVMVMLDLHVIGGVQSGRTHEHGSGANGTQFEQLASFLMCACHGSGRDGRAQSWHDGRLNSMSILRRPLGSMNYSYES